MAQGFSPVMFDMPFEDALHLFQVDGSTALHVAARRGHHSAANALLDAGSSIEARNVRCNNAETSPLLPVEVVCFARHPALFRVVFPNFFKKRQTAGHTPFQEARGNMHFFTAWLLGDVSER